MRLFDFSVYLESLVLGVLWHDDALSDVMTLSNEFLLGSVSLIILDTFLLGNKCLLLSKLLLFGFLILLHRLSKIVLHMFFVCWRHEMGHSSLAIVLSITFHPHRRLFLVNFV